MPNILIDTNVFIRAATTPKVCEELYALIEYAKAENMEFLLHELVEAELKKFERHYVNNLQESMALLSKTLRESFLKIKRELWNEVQDIEKFLIDKANEFIGEKAQHIENLFNDLKRFFNNGNVQIIETSAEAMKRIKKKVASGEINQNIENDSYILEGIKEYCNVCNDISEIFFISENKKDFFKVERNQDGSYKLDIDGCDKVKGFASLAHSLSHLKEVKNV